MENITLGQVATALAFLVSLIGSLEFIFIRLKRFISKEIKPLKIESIKVDLVNLMCFAEQGIISEEQKKLAYELFDDERHMVRIDCSEYMESFNVSRLIGAPPGYVGYDEGGQLTEAVRRNPYSIVLFDEIEKAHSDVFNILLQILDDGRITDSQGRTVDFKNTIIIMTSNIGSQYVLDGQDDKVLDELKIYFKPEFINRIDEIIIFNELSKDVLYNVLDKIIREIEKRLEIQHLKLKLTEEAKDYLIERGYDVAYGARPLKRLVTSSIETLLAKKIIAGEVKFGDVVTVDVKEGEIVLK